MTSSYTVASYLIDRLKEVGVDHVFGVPGDYDFPFLDAIEAEPTIQWVGVCNELNAAYAADGYARVRGLSAVTGSCGVLEMGAGGGVAGAFSEEVPLLVISGFPSTDEMARRTFTHHSLRGRFDQYRSMMAPITAWQTLLTAADACEQIDEAIKQCWALKAPVYIQFPRDIQELAAGTPASPLELAEPQSDHAELERFVERALPMLRSAERPAILFDFLVARLGPLQPHRGYPRTRRRRERARQVYGPPDVAEWRDLRATGTGLLGPDFQSDDVVFTLIKDGDHRLSRPQDLARMLGAVEEVAG